MLNCHDCSFKEYREKTTENENEKNTKQVTQIREETDEKTDSYLLRWYKMAAKSINNYYENIKDNDQLKVKMQCNSLIYRAIHSS